MRISGGVHRSRRLASPRGKSTRPTSDRVREALFSILESRGLVSGARVVDLCAGTGALGLEALSRGAAFATFVEPDRKAREVLAENVAALGEQARSRVLPVPAARAVILLEGDGASLVLCDPPYADVGAGHVTAWLSALCDHRVTSADATLVLEHATRDGRAVASMPFEQLSTHVYGDTTLTLFRGPLPRVHSDAR